MYSYVESIGFLNMKCMEMLVIGEIYVVVM